MKYEVYSDAASGLHFAVVEEGGKCLFYYSDKSREEIDELIEAAKSGADLSRWQSGQEDPQASYEALLSDVEAGDGRVEIVDEYLIEN